MFQVKYSVLNFTLEIQSQCQLGENKVSALRGILGQALGVMNCFYEVENRQCKSCYLNEKCLGNSIVNTKLKSNLYFQSDKSFSPLVFRCHNKERNFEIGDRLNFTLIIFGDNVSYIPYIINAYEFAGTYLGLNSGLFTIEFVRNEFSEILFDGYRIDKEKIIISEIEDYIRARRRFLRGIKGIRLISPLIYKSDRKIQRTIDGEGLKKLLERRILTLNALEEKEILPIEINQFDLKEGEIGWGGYDRYSNRQNRTMKMEGITGYFTFSQLEENQIDYLIAGELIHIGKSSAFGFGEYEIY